jgi:3'-5' exoribonuclease
MTLLTISALKQQTGETPLSAAVLAQLQSRSLRSTKNNKPYLELTFADATGNASIKVWSDSPIYQQADALSLNEVHRIEAKWISGTYGLDAKDAVFAKPDHASLDDFYRGDSTLREKQDADHAVIEDLCASISDPRLHALCRMFLDQHGERFRRTAAAKKNHHARRGGLVEHVAQMMRSADALCPVYPEINRDLLLTGVLFHDCGKLWENTYPEHGFAQKIDYYGELLGHISLGIELVNKLWRDLLETPQAAEWPDLVPPTDTVRIHLLHLIGSHHGEHQFGSPVLPRTPEAFALHFIDNLDAKMEMVRQGYANSEEIAPQIHDRVFPLPANLVKPLGRFQGP